VSIPVNPNEFVSPHEQERLEELAADKREKRFIAAVAAMNGMLANGVTPESRLCVEYADNLLTRLEKNAG
jgi:hypothetical protein